MTSENLKVSEGFKPEIGVVVPTFNRKDSVVKTVDSLLDQDTDRPYEIVIVDDGSIDGTFEHLQERYDGEINSVEDHINGYSDRRNPNGRITIIRQGNAHVAAARNTGLKRLYDRGARHFTYQDADDLALPNRLESLANFLDENPSIDFAHAKSQDIDSEDNVLKDGPYQRFFKPIWENWRKNGKASKKQRKNGNFVHNQAVMFNRNVIDHLGIDNLFWNGLKYGEDSDFVTKIENAELKFGFLNRYISQSRVGDMTGLTGMANIGLADLVNESISSDNLPEKIQFYKKALHLAQGDRSFLTDSEDVWEDFFSTIFNINFERDYAMTEGNLSDAYLFAKESFKLNPSRENRKSLGNIEKILRNDSDFKNQNDGRNILFLTPFYDNSCGVGTVAQSLTEELNNRGNNVEILEYAPWKSEGQYKFISKTGEEVKLNSSDEVIRFLEEHGKNYDVIHSHNQVFSNGNNENLFDYLGNTPILTQIHMIVPYANDVLGDDSPHRKEEAERQKRMMARSNKVIHLTKDLEDLANSYYGRDNTTPMGTVYNFAKPPELNREEVTKLKSRLAPNGEKLLLYAGRLSEEKGILELVQGFKQAKESNPDAKLVICGDRSNGKNFMAEVDRELEGLKDGRDYVYEGRVSQDKLQGYYGAADFFIQPSRYEHFSISLIEAMAHKTPVIMTKMPSMRKIMKLDEKDPGDRYAISIDDINSSDNIGSAINTALKTSRYDLDNMTKNANGFYQRELTPDKIAQRYEQEYDKLISARKDSQKGSP